MDISKARITGPCTVVFNGVNVGHTLDGIEFTAERDFADVKVDKYGDTPIDKVLIGNRVMLKFKLAQPDWRQLDLAIPETSSYDGAGVADRTDLGGDAGFSLRSVSAPLVIHPMKNAATDYTDDITIYKAVSYENIEIPYKVDEQQAVEVTMIGLVDESYGVGRRLGHIGPAAVS
jgi:hypothetical protein